MDQSDVKILFGKRIRELRKLRGWSQEEFALHVGLDRSYVGGVERGERNVSLEKHLPDFRRSRHTNLKTL